MTRQLLVAALLLCCLADCLTAAPHRSRGEAEVSLPFGTVKGNTLAEGAEFLGVPFAQPPTRFAPPVAWSARYAEGVFDATHFSHSCVQDKHPLGTNASSMTYSEDCLYLNIYTPHIAPGEKLPVMLWIHGGGLVTGSAMLPFYNGTVLANRERVVVVATNYRLNVFGFAPVREDGRTVANNGFKDQREAMRWVRKHIGAFGGNNESVTIFGESAGGQSVGVHLVSRGSHGLFDRAISESGDITSTRTLADALNSTAAISDALSCSDVDCLRNVNASQLFAAFQTQAANAFKAVIDGDVLLDEPEELVKKGAFNRVPYILGNNRDEGSLFVTLRNATADVARCVLNAAFDKEQASEVMGMYPVVDGVDNRAVLVEVLSDVFFHCGNRRFALALDAAKQPPWMYSFNRHPACPLEPVPGAAHAFEIPYVFGIVEYIKASPSCVVPEVDLTLAKQMSRLWADFARHGQADAAWPRFEAPRGTVLKLDASSDMDIETGYRRGQCAALDNLGVRMKGQFMGRFFGGMAACAPRL